MLKGSKKINQLLARGAKKGAGKDRRLTTAVTYNGEELAVLAEYIAAGIVLLRISKPHPAAGKFKAAMSRLKVAIPRGL